MPTHEKVNTKIIDVLHAGGTAVKSFVDNRVGLIEAARARSINAQEQYALNRERDHAAGKAANQALMLEKAFGKK